MTTVLEIVQAAIPNANDELANHVLWANTAYPFAHVDARTLYKAASRSARAEANNVRLCDWCSNKAEEGGWCCKRCGDALQYKR